MVAQWWRRTLRVRTSNVKVGERLPKLERLGVPSALSTREWYLGPRAGMMGYPGHLRVRVDGAYVKRVGLELHEERRVVAGEVQAERSGSPG